MSVIISNVTEPLNKGVYGRGLQYYILRINRFVLAEFTHRYEDGLAECLRKAAVAAEDPNRVEMQRGKIDLLDYIDLRKEDK